MKVAAQILDFVRSIVVKFLICNRVHNDQTGSQTQSGAASLPSLLSRQMLLSFKSRSIVVLAIIVATILIAGCEKSGVNQSEVNHMLKTMTKENVRAPKTMFWIEELLFNPSLANNYRDDETLKFWKSFREAYPFGLQGIAVSEVRTDGSSSVVVAEPPPHVTFDDIKKVIPDASIQTTPVGHDGYLYDVVGTIEGGNEQINSKLRLLNILLYRTDYKAYVYQEPFRKGWRDSARFPLEVQVSAAELHKWLYATGARFVPISESEGTTLTLEQLLAEKVSKVYRLYSKGLVVWWIPDGVTVSDCVEEIRMFALESDLVVGAVKNGGIMLIARQRILPYDLLPPLRAETIALLASVSTKQELSQSYQRNHPGAGTYSAGFDWAPILLSPELVDTEYGHILNIADQLLKGWSQHGEVKYENFPYQPPMNWPFPKAISDIVSSKFNKHSITFNWNTTGAGYIVSIGQVQVYVPFRTGALPISYIPGEDMSLAPEIAHYEDQAYEWYANLNNPILVRVVQYAAIYQAFNNMAANIATENAPKSDVQTRGLVKAMNGLWHGVDKVDNNSLNKLAENTAITRRVQKTPLISLSRQFDIPDDLLQSMDSSEKLTSEMLLKAYLEQVIKKELSDEFAAWKGLTPVQRNEIKQVSLSLEQEGMNEDISENLHRLTMFLQVVAEKEKIVDKYVAAVPSSGYSWIHTPSVVMSNPGENHSLAIGGHNLRAATTKFVSVSDQKVAQGTIQITNKSIELNAADIGRAPHLARKVERDIRSGKTISAIEAEASDVLKHAPASQTRTSAQALKLPGHHTDQVPISPRVKSITSEVPAEVQMMLGDVSHFPQRIAIVNHNNYFWVSGPNGKPTIPTTNLADASYLASLMTKNNRGSLGSKPMEFQFSNLNDIDREVLLKNLRLNAKRGKHDYSDDIVAIIGAERNGFFKSFSSHDYDFKNPKISIKRQQIINDMRVSQVIVELNPKRTGISKAIIEFWIKVKITSPKTLLADIASAIKTRSEQIFARIASGEIRQGSLDPLVMLKHEANRLKAQYNCEIEIKVHDARKDWWLATTGNGAAYA